MASWWDIEGGLDAPYIPPPEARVQSFPGPAGGVPARTYPQAKSLVPLNPPTGAQGGQGAPQFPEVFSAVDTNRSLSREPEHVQKVYWDHWVISQNLTPAQAAQIWVDENDKGRAPAAAGDTSSAAAAAAAAKEEAAIAQAKADRAAADQKAKDAAAPAPIPAIPQSQSLDPNKPGGIQTGPVAGAVKGQLFGDTKYNLALGDGGVAPGGGNPNEMYRWFIEAFSQGYDNAMDLWTKSPEEAIGAYNQWKIKAQADGVHFIGVDEQGNPGGGRLIRKDRQDAFKTAIAEGEQQAATPGVGAGILGALREGSDTFSGIEQGTQPDFSIWEEMQRTGMAGTPFADDAEKYLQSQIPQYEAQGAMQSLRDQTPLGISDFLQQSYGGASMSPEDLRMLISGQPGAGVNPVGFTNILDALDQTSHVGTSFNLALAGSPLANAPAAFRDPLAGQIGDYWNEFKQGKLGGSIEDVPGQADFLRFAANKMGIV